MLSELRIKDLGVIAALDLELRGGMTVVTGETGAGKTLLVAAIDLLLGGRAEPLVVRSGAARAEVEGRFVTGEGEGEGEGGGGTELVLGRVVPVTGRSRAYLDGRMAPATVLAEAGRDLVDLHGQHAHQSLLAPAVQRAVLDGFGGVDHGPATTARRRLAELERELAACGGDERARAREADLLDFQVRELAEAGLSDPAEDETLALEEDRLAQAAAHREAASAAHHTLAGDGGAADAVGYALSALSGRAPLSELAGRLHAVAADLADLASDLRTTAETLEDDLERLEQVRVRRVLLRELCRKYGESLTEVMAYATDARARVAELASHADRVAALEEQRAAARQERDRADAVVGAARRAAAGRLGDAVAGHLHTLAMAGARFEVEVGAEGAGDDVAFLLSANPGEAALPLARVASGGELARTMLALRLVVGHRHGPKPATLIFDEVDAGVGGETALAVGRALAAVAAGPGAPQVLVVTHLAQVAAFADHQLVVRKITSEGRTVVVATHVDGEDRVVELSRMLSGQPDSSTARGHAQELLTAAALGRRS